MVHKRPRISPELWVTLANLIYPWTSDMSKISSRQNSKQESFYRGCYLETQFLSAKSLLDSEGPSGFPKWHSR